MRLFTGDKRRDPNLDIMMKAPNTLQPPAHPPMLLLEKCDGFHPRVGDHVDHFYIICLNFVFYAMTHLYRRYGSALGGSDIDVSFTKPKQPPPPIVYVG